MMEYVDGPVLFVENSQVVVNITGIEVTHLASYLNAVRDAFFGAYDVSTSKKIVIEVCAPQVVGRQIGAWARLYRGPRRTQ